VNELKPYPPPHSEKQIQNRWEQSNQQYNDMDEQGKSRIEGFQHDGKNGEWQHIMLIQVKHNVMLAIRIINTIVNKIKIF
jgi:hypothetical protein